MKIWSKRKKKSISIIAVVLVIALTGGGLSYHFLFAQEAAEISYKEVALQNGNLSLDIIGDGTTQISTVSQIPEFQASAVTLTVEEVYVSSGNTVAAGDALMKLTADSVAEAKTYYEETIAKAKTTLSDAQSSYNVGILEAQYDKEKTLTTAEYAEDSYEASLAELTQKVTDAKTELNNAKTQISTYTKNLKNNTYYTQNGVADKKAAVKKAQKAANSAQTAYENAVKTYDDLKKTVSDGIAALSAANLSEQSAQLQKDFASLTTAKDSIDKAKEDLERAQSDLSQKKSESEQAQSNYEKQVEEAEQQKEQLENSLSQLESSYEEAQRNLTTQKVNLKNTYDTAVVKGEYAQTTYDSTVTALEDAVTAAQENLDILEEEQTALLALEDGVITAAEAGTIASVSYEEGDTFVSKTAIVSYYETDTIMITIQVSQADISKMAVGDSVDVSISGVRRNGLTGTVSTIATEATSDTSVSKVTYEVTVSIDNSEGSISTGLSASVTYNYGELENVYYIETDAVSDVDGTKANVKQYDKNGEVVSVPVTIGEQTDSYTVITEGISEGDICLIEIGGQSSEEK